jgi:hypothetical protein
MNSTLLNRCCDFERIEPPSPHFFVSQLHRGTPASPKEGV